MPSRARLTHPTTPPPSLPQMTSCRPRIPPLSSCLARFAPLYTLHLLRIGRGLVSSPDTLVSRMLNAAFVSCFLHTV